MKSLNNNVNANIIAALRVSEKTKVPFLLLSSPGVGKTATLQAYCDVRGYDLIMLILSRCNIEDVNGCDVFSGDKEDRSLAKMRPNWFQRVMNNHEKGITSVLFLDEITTAPQHIQGAALNLVFDREVAGEHLPEDTLVVSAGNYCQSLGNQFTLIPPLMNRFCIFNIEPTINDIELFLSHYKGASLGDGSGSNLLEMTKNLVKEIDSQERAYDEKYLLSVAEYTEKAVFETTKMLINTKKVLNLKVKDMQNLFNETDSNFDQKLFGFISPRSLYYLVKVTLGTYKCFGLEGIKSENFKNMINGLVGIALSMDSKKEVVPNYVGDDYFIYIGKAINDVESKNNSKVSEYITYFSSIITENDKKGKVVMKKSLTNEEINSINNKMSELISDPLLKNIERPIEIDSMRSISKLLKTSSLNLITGVNKDSIDVGGLSKVIIEWNLIKSLERSVVKFLQDSSRGYEEKQRTPILEDYDEFDRHAFKLQYIIKDFSKRNTTEAAMLPRLDGNK